MFGKNIKKIRGVKGLTQQSFADLFGLKRATLAAYEEGRSNPRVETVLTVAEYFGLDMDELMKTELTVNRLLAFNDSLTTHADILPVQAFCQIPCLTEALEADFIRQGGMTTRKLPTLQLPLLQAKGFIGYTIHAADMANNGMGYLPRDIVILEDLEVALWPEIGDGTPVLALSGRQLIFRYGSIVSDQLCLEAEIEGIEALMLPLTEIQKLWTAKHVFKWKLPVKNDSFEQRLLHLEKRVHQLQI